MWLFYLLALILGGGILFVQLVAGGHHGLDHGGLDHGGGPHPYEGPGVMSVRSATYGLFVLGLVGGTLHVLSLARPALALTGGLVAGGLTTFFVGLTFKRLSDPEASGEAGFHQAKGGLGRVLVACARGSRGKIRVALKGQQVDMLATTDEESIPVGTEVRVVEMRDDVAHVART